jgi:hypothetical protein
MEDRAEQVNQPDLKPNGGSDSIRDKTQIEEDREICGCFGVHPENRLPGGRRHGQVERMARAT